MFELIVVVGVVVYLIDVDFEVFECSILVCELFVVGYEQVFDQCCEDIYFYDVLVVVYLNVFLWCFCWIINQMLYLLVIVVGNVMQCDYQVFGCMMFVVYCVIFEVVWWCDVQVVECLMVVYMDEVEV